MLEALGIDGESLARTDPLMVRDMQRVCAMCRDKAQFDADLADGTAAEHFKSYCSNASTLEVLGQPAKH